jgi:hydroxymethylbilane synthase
MGLGIEGSIDDFLPLQIIKTEGDLITDRRLIEAGGKALFTKAIDEALLGHKADMAVHSFKDVPAHLPMGLDLTCIPRREDPKDALITKNAASLDRLKKGAIVGTASLRRKAQLLRARPDLEIRLLRGNIDTRLQKLDNGEFDAIVLAAAGLHRLGLKERITEYLDIERFLPAAAQGALSIQCREGDVIMGLDVLDHSDTRFQVMAERGAMQALEASCRSAVGAYGEIKDKTIILTAEILAENGQQSWRQTKQFLMTSPEEAFLEGLAVGEVLKASAGDKLVWSQFDN